MIEKYSIVTFESTSGSMAADKCLEKNSINHKLIPVPQEISAGCGFCIRLERQELEGAVAALKVAGVSISGCFNLEKKGLYQTKPENVKF